MTIAYSTTLRNNRLDEITALRDGGGGVGFIRIYNGTRPSTGGTATTLLAQLSFSATSSPAASGATLTASSITDDSSADATGTATWFREVDNSGTFILDGDVGTDLVLNDNDIVSGVPVSITSYVITGGNA